jgi:SAM-dependent methyltransferase
MLGPPLSVGEADLYDSSVVPRYLAYFGSLAATMFLPCEQAQIAHLGCRTGYPGGVIVEKVLEGTLVGIDGSAPALEMARAKAALTTDVQVTYLLGEAIPTELPSDAFTHALAVHPLCDAEGRSRLLAELYRVLLPGGQALISLPLRGSFPEINDMIREFALRQDLDELAKAIDVAASSRPTIETVSEEFESAGLTEVDVDVQLIAVSFDNGREFLEDPIARLIVFPELNAMLPMEETVAAPCMKYLHEAITKYWSDGVFELTVNVGCASGRRLA